MDASANSSHPSRDKRIKSIIAFCHDLQKRLRNKNDDQALKDLTDGLKDQIDTIKPYVVKHPGSHRHTQLDEVGKDLWNWCVDANHKSDGDVSPARHKLLTSVRVFSFLILALAQRSDHNTPKDLLRLEKVAIKAGRSCIVNGELDFARTVLQKAAEYDGLLQNMQAKLPTEELNEFKKSQAEYLTLRTVLAWKENRLDVADHLYEKIQDHNNDIIDPESVGNLADAFYEIGKDLTAQRNFPLAAKWLERAYECINIQEIERLSREVVELRLAISQALVRAYLDVKTEDGFQKAENHVGYIESEIGDKLVVLLLRLELLLSSPAEVFDSGAYADILRRMIRSLDVSESSFNLIMHHIRKLEDKSPSLAVSVLDDFITSRVLPTQHEEWVERTVVLRAQMATTHRDTHGTIQELTATFDSVAANLEKPLSAAVVLAIQILMWKKIDASFSQQELAVTERWCRVAMHSALCHSGPANTAKIARKLLSCALQRNDLGNAIETFRSMSESARREPMTLYLGYKLALRSRDREMASDCLKNISEASLNDPQYLYACCMDAQEAEDKECAIEALRYLISRSEYSSSDVIHLPALLRVIIRLELSLINTQGSESAGQNLLVDDICEAFECAVTAIQRDPRNGQGEKLFVIEELNWFSKNAYNLGLKNIHEWHPAQSIRIFQCCLSIISQYPQDIPGQAADDLSLRAMFCHFLIATAFIALARPEDSVETQLQHYLTMRNHVKGFDTALEARLENLDEVSKTDLQMKLSTLLNLSAFQAMADCILRAQSVPGQVLYSTLRKIINHIFSLEYFDNGKLAKYLRCLLKATLASEPEFPLKIMEDICRLVKQCAASQQPISLEEVAWFTTTAFNHGVDLYGTNEDESSKKWIAHALTLAHYHQDGGDLERELQKRQINLKWDA
ncbi:SPO22-domain-containing protein [Hypoxylon trugodes]|uniref:SPO22-domain-containing protein n=1 Tax=Hypoxylon trugodes TaxID=326681 RepID=UPI0021915764|nr:SPO22-domain-containing protein [Hypoxylon trugodes]KAI1388233.1 SPO22-domain-containing protein [Hypoxylon trugodes]